jgi:hypothetical protein
VKSVRSLIACGLLLLLVAAGATPSPASSAEGFAGAVGLTFDSVESVSVTDATDDLFTLEGGSLEGPGYVDIVETEQFGFTLTDDAFTSLFGEDGALACDPPRVSCPTYDIQTEPFAEGVFVVGIELAEAPAVSGTDVLTVAVLAPSSAPTRPGESTSPPATRRSGFCRS